MVEYARSDARCVLPLFILTAVDLVKMEKASVEGIRTDLCLSSSYDMFLLSFYLDYSMINFTHPSRRLDRDSGDSPGHGRVSSEDNRECPIPRYILDNCRGFCDE